MMGASEENAIRVRLRRLEARVERLEKASPVGIAKHLADQDDEIGLHHQRAPNQEGDASK